MRADYHVHTAFSDDSDYPMEQVVRDAIALGLEELCFTDHVDTIQWGTTQLRTDSFDWISLRTASGEDHTFYIHVHCNTTTE